jgi:aldose 1-epimerase
VPDLETILRHEDAALHIDLDAGGRITQLTVDGLDILAHVDITSPFHWGSFVMAPWAGRIRRGRFDFAGRSHQLPINFERHAIHGVVMDQPWRLVDKTAESAVLDCPLDERWPWRGHVRQIITLSDRTADFVIEVHADDEPFPAAAGWHPWFRRRLARGGEVAITFDAEALLVRDAEWIPTGVRAALPDEPFDDCYDHVRWPITLTWPDALRLEVFSGTRYGVIYTEPADAVCVEPQTGPPDSPTLEPEVVMPGQPLIATMSWRWPQA